MGFRTSNFILICYGFLVYGFVHVSMILCPFHCGERDSLCVHVGV